MTVPHGTARPVVKVPAFELAARGGPGAKVYSNVKAYQNGKLIGVSQPPPAAVAASGYVSIRTPIPSVAKGVDYVVSFELSDAKGNRLYRYASLGGV
jgi:hypothetical protein